MARQPDQNHHVYPLRTGGGHTKENEVTLPASHHARLHKVCDIPDLDSKLDVYQSKLQQCLVVSPEIISEQYQLIQAFFANMHTLPGGLRQNIGNKLKDIITYHLRQHKKIIGEPFPYVTEELMSMLAGVHGKRQFEALINLDRDIMKNISNKILSTFNKEFSGLKKPKTARSLQNSFSIPLKLRGRFIKENELYGFSDNELMKLYHVAKVGKGFGGRRRSARKVSNEKFIIGSHELEYWGDMQHIFMEKIQEILDDDNTLNRLKKAVQKSLKTQALLDKSRYEYVTGNKNEGENETISKQGIIENLKTSLFYQGALGDEIKDVMSKKYHYFVN